MDDKIINLTEQRTIVARNRLPTYYSVNVTNYDKSVATLPNYSILARIFVCVHKYNGEV